MKQRPKKTSPTSKRRVLPKEEHGDQSKRKRKGLDRRKFIRYAGVVIGGFALLGMPKIAHSDPANCQPMPDPDNDLCFPDEPDDDPDVCGPSHDLRIGGDECHSVSLEYGDEDVCDPDDGAADICSTATLWADTDVCRTDDYGDMCAKPTVSEPNESDKCWIVNGSEVGDVCNALVTGENDDTDECGPRKGHPDLPFNEGDDCSNPAIEPGDPWLADKCLATGFQPATPEEGDECDSFHIAMSDPDVCAAPWLPCNLEGGDWCTNPPALPDQDI